MAAATRSLHLHELIDILRRLGYDRPDHLVSKAQVEDADLELQHPRRRHRPVLGDPGAPRRKPSRRSECPALSRALAESRPPGWRAEARVLRARQIGRLHCRRRRRSHRVARAREILPPVRDRRRCPPPRGDADAIPPADAALDAAAVPGLAIAETNVCATTDRKLNCHGPYSSNL